MDPQINLQEEAKTIMTRKQSKVHTKKMLQQSKLKGLFNKEWAQHMHQSMHTCNLLWNFRIENFISHVSEECARISTSRKRPKQGVHAPYSLQVSDQSPRLYISRMTISKRMHPESICRRWLSNRRKDHSQIQWVVIQIRHKRLTFLTLLKIKLISTILLCLS